MLGELLQELSLHGKTPDARFSDWWILYEGYRSHVISRRQRRSHHLPQSRQCTRDV